MTRSACEDPSPEHVPASGRNRPLRAPHSLAPVSAQRHQLTAHRIEPPQEVSSPSESRSTVFDGIFAAGTAAGRIGRYPVGSLRGSPVNALHGSPVGTLRGKQLRKEQNQNQQQSFHNRHVLGCNQSMSPTPNEKRMAVRSRMLFEQRNHAVTGEEPETAIADTETDPELIGPEPGQAVFSPFGFLLINRVGAQEGSRNRRRP